MPVALSCGDDQSTARISALVPGAEDVACTPWDIGTGVAGYAWQAPDPKGVVLFQHGWGDYTQRWVNGADGFITALLADGYSVYGIDMWGNGRSPGVRGAVDVEGSVADHLTARHLLAEQDLPIFLAGHSLGGLVTATSLARDGEDVAGVVLLAPALKYDTNGFTRAVAAAGGFLLPTVAAPETGTGDTDLEGADRLTRDPAIAEQLDTDPVLYMGSVPWITAAGGANVSYDNWEQYRDITAPLLVLHGTADISTDPTGSSDLVDAVSSDDAQLVLLEGVRHSILDDLDADTALREILGWLDQRTPGQ